MRAQPTCLGPETIPRHLARWSERLARVLNGNVSYGSSMSNKDADNNMQAFKASGTAPGTANTAFTLTHTLGKVPIAIVGQVTDNGGVLYGDVTTWTKTAVTLKCTVASSNYRVIVA